MTLDQVKPGTGGVIATVGGEGALRRHLLDMGLTPGTAVQVRRVAPMGDPIELVLRGYVLTIRLEDAAKIGLRETETEETPEEVFTGRRRGGFRRMGREARNEARRTEKDRERRRSHASSVGACRQSEQRQDDPV